MRYLALGDSYTIGEAVPQADSFPFQLVKVLEETQLCFFDEVKVVAKTGWTTDELIEAIKGEHLKPPYDLVTLLIGVNNEYRGYPIDRFEKEFEELLITAIKLAEGNANRVIVVTIPDYGCTPFGAEKATQIDRQLREYNRICLHIATKHTVFCVDIFEVSKKAKGQTDLIAEDQLHPSEEMYSLWVEKIFPIAKTIVQLP